MFLSDKLNQKKSKLRTQNHRKQEMLQCQKKNRNKTENCRLISTSQEQWDDEFSTQETHLWFVVVAEEQQLEPPLVLPYCRKLLQDLETEKKEKIGDDCWASLLRFFLSPLRRSNTLSSSSSSLFTIVLVVFALWIDRFFSFCINYSPRCFVVSSLKLRASRACPNGLISMNLGPLDGHRIQRLECR